MKHLLTRSYQHLALLLVCIACTSGTISSQECLRSPVISCPSIYFGCTGDDLSPDAIGYATAVPGDDNCPTPIITYRDSTITQDLCGNGTEIKRFWKATYPADINPWLFAECTQVLVLRDTEAPVLTNCPQDISVGTGPDCRAIVRWNEPTASDDCGLLLFTSNYGSGSAFYPGVTTVTYTATDNCGNTTTCSFDISVHEACCNDAPTISVPNDITICPTADPDPAVTGQATAILQGTDCGTPTITYSDRFVQQGNCAGEGYIERDWTATNPANGATSTGTQTIYLSDNNAPTIFNCPSDITITATSNCTAVVNWPLPTSTDGCALSSFTSTHASGSTFGTGTTVVSYLAVDLCGNTSECSFAVTVVGSCCDGTPSIHAPVNYSACPNSSTDPTQTGYATGSIAGDNCPTPTITYSDQTSTSGCTTTITRTWTATHPDYPERVASAVQTITLTDAEAPVIANCPGDITVPSSGNSTTIVNYMIPTVSDNCGIAFFGNDRPTGSGSSFTVGTTTVNYTARDVCGNVATCSFNVTVTPHDDPCTAQMVLNCPSDYQGCPSGSSHPNITGRPTTNSTSDCPVTVTYFDQTVTVNDCNSGSIIRRYWIAARSNGMDQDTCVQTLRMIDDHPPVITNCVPSVTLTYDNRTYTWADPQVTDACEITYSYSTPKGTTFPVGTTDVTASVTDGCGRTTTCTFRVTVLGQDTGASLIVNCPTDLEISCNMASGPVPYPTASTDCTSCDLDTIPGFVYMGVRGGSKYFCSTQKMIWPDAKAYCEQSGGRLAIINDQEENDFLASLLVNTQRAYIGLSDADQEGTFEWVDGSGLSYQNWYPGQPNDYYHKQDYVELLHNGLWNDQYNDKPQEFIMELGCIEIVQTNGPTDLGEVTESTSVSFDITDGCGNHTTCSYLINVSASTSTTLHCPSDISVDTPEDETVVYFDAPTFETCCTQCGHGQEISGFVYMGERDGSYYYCSKDKATWHEANQITREHGGHLAIIDDAMENRYLANILKNTIAFIGVSDHQTEDHWLNVNGQVQQYFNWRYDNPNNYYGTQHYVELEPSGYWNDNTGDYHREYIMEVRGCGTIRQVAGPSSGSYFPQGTSTVSFEATDACGNSESCSFDIEITGGQTSGVTYCSSIAQNSSRAYIHKVQINDRAYTSGNNNGYQYNDDQCITLTPGQDYEVYATPGWPSYRYLAYYRLYIDYNGDGDFDDGGEYLGKAFASSVIGAKRQVPHDAKPGLTRLRIVMSLTDYEDSCGSYRYGETEDICVYISATGAAKQTNDKYSGYQEPITFRAYPERSPATPSRIYPNPTSDYVQIRSAEQLSKIKIYNIYGQDVTYTPILSQKVDLSVLPAGMYMIHMTDTDGVQSIERVIKK